MNPNKALWEKGDFTRIAATMREAAKPRKTLHLASTRESWLGFVALLVCPGCLTHLIVLRFGDAFFEHLRTLAPSLGIFVFSEGVCCLPSRRARHGIPTARIGYGFTTLFLRIHFRFSRHLTFGLLIVSLGRFGRMSVNRG